MQSTRMRAVPARNPPNVARYTSSSPTVNGTGAGSAGVTRSLARDRAVSAWRADACRAGTRTLVTASAIIARAAERTVSGIEGPIRVAASGVQEEAGGNQCGE